MCASVNLEGGKSEVERGMCAGVNLGEGKKGRRDV